MYALCQVSWIFPAPVTVHSIVPYRRKNSEHTRNTFRGKCPMIVPFSQPQRIDRKHFQGLFRTQTTLQPPPPYFLMHVAASNTLWKSFPQQLLSPYVFSLCSKLPLLHAHAAQRPITLLQTLCCKIFMLKYFRRTPTLRNFSTWKFFQRKFRITKISHFTVSAISQDQHSSNTITRPWLAENRLLAISQDQ